MTVSPEEWQANASNWASLLIALVDPLRNDGF